MKSRWMHGMRGWASPFALVCSVGLLGRLSYEMMRSPVTPLYAKHIGAPVQLIGLIVGAVTITGIAVKMPAGALSDVFGVRRMMLAGAVVKAGGPFLYLLAFVWPVLLVVRFVHGLATALYSPPASAFVAKTYPESRGRKLGIYNAAENVGIVLGPVAGGVVLALTVSNFPATFLIAGGIGVAALLVMTRVPRSIGTATADPAKTLRAVVAEAASGVRQIVADPRVRVVSLVEAGMWVGIGSVQAYLPIFALTIGLRVWQIGVVAGAQGVVSIVGRPLIGRFSDSLGSRTPFIVAGSLICIGALIGIPYASGFVELIIIAAVFGAGTGIVTPATTALIGDLAAGKSFGAAMGVFGSLWDAGHAAGPIIFGYLLVAVGYRTAWLILAIVMAAALSWYSVDRARSRRQPARGGQ